MPKSNSELIGEEILGAELLASRELVEGAGSIWDAIERGSVIHSKQLSLLFEDYQKYWRELAQPDPFAWPRATTSLALRRLQHISDGWHEVGELLRDEVTPIGRAWSGFFEMVRQDWRR